jgi:hypothetical protein
MGTFLKKHWLLLALFLAGGAFLLFIQHLNSSNDEAIAQIMADRVVGKLRARVAALDAKYAALNAAKDGEIIALQQGRKVLSGQVVKWRKFSEDAQAKIKDLEGCMAGLDDCQAKVAEIDAAYTIELAKADRACGEKVALKDAELAERRTLDTANINTIGNLTKRVVMLEQWKRRKLVIGPQAGYGPGGAYVGVGVTFEIFRIKAPGVF